jgi:hypothetical protein
LYLDGIARANSGWRKAVNAEQLKALQAPVKNLYRENPDRARLTLRATGTLQADRVVCMVDTFEGL